MAQRKSNGDVPAAVEEGERIQAAIDQKDRKQSKSEKAEPMQAGAREYPGQAFLHSTSRSPASKPISKLAPMYEAPGYKGSEKLKDMVAIITGGDSGIGRAVAVLYAREGADVAIVYLNEHEDAEETKRAVEEEGRHCILIAGDVAEPDFCTTRGREDRRQASAGSTFSSTTPPSSSTPTTSPTSATSISTARSRPISTATSTWRARPSRI